MRTSFAFFLEKAFRTLYPGQIYIPNWHVELIAEYVHALYDGEIKRLIVNMPPRYMKSDLFSVAFPAWILGKNPSKQILAASYADELAKEFSIKTRNICEAGWFRRAFKNFEFAPDQNEKNFFKTTLNGYRKATSVGTSRIGFGGDYLIADDPLNPKQAESKIERQRSNDWFDTSFYTRQNNKKDSRIVVVQQRLHDDDLTGHLLKKSKEMKEEFEGLGYHHLSIPAIAENKIIISFRDFYIEREPGDLIQPAREGPREMAESKLTLGSRGFSAQYQQVPAPAEGAVFNLKWFRRFDGTDDFKFIRIVQSWDTAYKPGQYNDPSVCTTWGEALDGYYLLGVWRDRVTYPALKKKFAQLASLWMPSVILIEDKASGQSLIQEMRSETLLPIIPILPESDKLTRAHVISPLVEAGRVWLPTSGKWLTDFEQELMTFPTGEHDDQVDSMSQFLSWATRRGDFIIMGTK